MNKKFWGKKPAETLALMLNTLKPKKLWVNSRNEGALFPTKPDWPAGVGADWVEQEMSVNAVVVPYDGGWIVEWDNNVFREESAAALVLFDLMGTDTRVRVFLGKDGNVWPEQWDVLGRIGVSTGEKPCFLLVHNTRSMGGGAIMVDSVMGIQTTKGVWLYKHPQFDLGEWAVAKDGDGWIACMNGEGQAYCFKTEQKALNYCSFMKGERFKT